MSGSLKDALTHARRERPQPLPADFSATVMDRVRSASRPAIRPRDWLAMAAAAVVTAVVIPLAASPNDRSDKPPSMGLFSDQGGTFLFVTR